MASFDALRILFAFSCYWAAATTVKISTALHWYKNDDGDLLVIENIVAEPIDVNGAKNVV